jgi:hypothetical protein
VPTRLPEYEIFMTRRFSERHLEPGWQAAAGCKCPQRFPDQTSPMSMTIRKMLTHPVLALGSTVLWGLIEFFALNRMRRNGR